MAMLGPNDQGRGPKKIEMLIQSSTEMRFYSRLEPSTRAVDKAIQRPRLTPTRALFLKMTLSPYSLPKYEKLADTDVIMNSLKACNVIAGHSALYTTTDDNSNLEIHHLLAP